MSETIRRSSCGCPFPAEGNMVTHLSGCWRYAALAATARDVLGMTPAGTRNPRDEADDIWPGGCVSRPVETPKRPAT
jgi:hypothetical protein